MATKRWHIIIGWMPQVPDYNDLKYSLIPAVAYVRCPGCGVTGQCRATERQWTSGASKRQFRLIQRQLCVKCQYDPDETAMLALGEIA